MPQPNRNRSTLGRRTFLKAAGVSVTGLAAMSRQTVAAAGGSEPPVSIGVIGCGRRGTQLIEAAAQLGLSIPMVCDVDAARLAAAAEMVARFSGHQPIQTSDYQDVIDSDQVEAVIIATPDHWHASPFLMACAAGKAIYVETPLALQQHEAGAMAYAARKYKRVAQVGLQQRSSRTFVEAAGIVRSGTLGRIAQVRTWGLATQTPITKAPDEQAPASLDYDRWLGPSPQRPFNPARLQCPMHFWDYGGGEAAMWNVHQQDLMSEIMQVTVPKSVVAVGGNYGLSDFRETPDTLDVLFEYSHPRGDFVQAFSLRLSNAYAAWGPAALPPAREANDPLQPARSGLQVFGSEKTLYVSGSRLLLLPAGADSPVEDLQYLGIGTKSEIPAPASQPTVDPLTVAHLKQFAESVRSHKEPSGTIEAGETSLFPCIAANIAYRVGRKLYVNPSNRSFFTDAGLQNADEEANKLMRRMDREPYLAPKV